MVSGRWLMVGMIFPFVICARAERGTLAAHHSWNSAAHCSVNESYRTIQSTNVLGITMRKKRLVSAFDINGVDKPAPAGRVIIEQTLCRRLAGMGRLDKRRQEMALILARAVEPRAAAQACAREVEHRERELGQLLAAEGRRQ